MGIEQGEDIPDDKGNGAVLPGTRKGDKGGTEIQ